MDQSGESPLTQQSAVSEADSLYSSQNREFSAPGTAGENSSMAVGDKSPVHVISEPGNLHSVNLAGQTTAPVSCCTRALTTPSWTSLSLSRPST